MKEKNKLKIAVATHKKFQMPTQAGYFPLHVGKSRHTQKLSEYVGDDTGDNISDKNPFFCELTGLYWAWKNLDSDYLGLAHYRRYFTNTNKIPKEENEKFKIYIIHSCPVCRNDCQFQFL